MPGKWEFDTGTPQERKALYTSLVVSLFLLVTGLTWGYMIGLKANAVDHELSHVQDSIEFYTKAAKRGTGAAQ